MLAGLCVGGIVAGTSSGAWAESAVSLGAELSIDSVVHEALSAEGLSSRVSWSDGRLSLELRAERIELPEPVGTLRAARVECAELRLTRREVACDDARLWGRSGDLRLDGHRLALAWARDSGHLRLAGDWPGWFGGRGSLRADFAPERGWDVDARLRGLDLQALVAFDRQPVELPVAIGDGRADLDLRLRPGSRVTARLGLEDVAFSDPLGLQAGEELRATAQLSGDGTRWDLDLALEGGGVYIDPWFLDLDEEGPVKVSLNGLEGDPGTLAFRMDALDLLYGDALETRGEAVAYEPGAGLDGVFYGRVHALAPVYDALLAPWLAGTVLGHMATGGQLEGRVELVGSQPRRADLEWSELDASDRRGRFGLAGARGALDWSADEAGSPGTFAMDVAHLYGLPFDAFEAQVRALPAGLELLAETEIPIFDGGLRVGAFELRQTDAGPDVRFEGGIRAISLEPLTEVLGWPRFSGRLAGMIPRVRYERGDLNVDGRLLVQVFNGEVILRDVYIHDLLGYAPELGLSAEIQRLDLDPLTQAFDFGRVQGRISGHVRDLVMVDWSPVHMDLQLMTPERDPGRRRISQRAVEDMTELGGGLQAAASSVFLRVFENFSYRRLGFRCELRGEVCTVSGVADRPDGGFVLVQGGGIPQIRVIGYNRRVDWPELINRLGTIQAGDGPVVH
ncbi:MULTISPECIES: hypothetical protein [Thioalkalivibrio]|uniref:hypothetical protein n=1 Tax=Thioalkalivibrio TaxID=106633 RepID=UPI000475662F|nr:MULTISPECIES: hypothetical protein [Thioalkalivibrio]